jgi:TPR repeat protein
MPKKQRKPSTSLKRGKARSSSLIKRAEKGDAEAQYNLGLMMVIGEGIEKDLQKGMEWMEQAVANGYELSAHVLAIIYREGMYGMKPSPSKAARWNKKAGSFTDKS